LRTQPLIGAPGGRERWRALAGHQQGHAVVGEALRHLRQRHHHPNELDQVDPTVAIDVADTHHRVDQALDFEV